MIYIFIALLGSLFGCAVFHRYRKLSPLRKILLRCKIKSLFAKAKCKIDWYEDELQPLTEETFDKFCKEANLK